MKKQAQKKSVVKPAPALPAPKVEVSIGPFVEDLYNEYKIRADIGRVITHIEDNLRKVQHRISAYVAFSKRLLKEKNYKHANNLLGEGLTKYSNSGALMMEMGKLKYVMQIYLEAADYFTSALDTADVNKEETLYNLGLSHLQMGRNEEAVRELKEVLKLNSNFVDAIATLGLVYKRLNKKEEALDAYKKALSLSPNDSEVLNNIGTLLYEKEEYEKASLEFFKALQIKHDDIEVLSNLGSTLVKMRKYQQAWVAFDEALKISPANTQLLENYLLCLLEGKEFDKFDDMLFKIKFLNVDVKSRLQSIAREYKEKLGGNTESSVRRSSTFHSSEEKPIRSLLRKKVKGKSRIGNAKPLPAVPEEAA